MMLNKKIMIAMCMLSLILSGCASAENPKTETSSSGQAAHSTEENSDKKGLFVDSCGSKPTNRWYLCGLSDVCFSIR